MKISPTILLIGLGLGLIVLPETIINIPLFPFGRTDAAIVPLNNDIPAEYINATAATAQHNQSDAADAANPHLSDAANPNPSPIRHSQSPPIERILFGESRTMRAERRSSAVGGRYPHLECAACEYLANGVNKTILHNPKVIAFVTADIEKVCSVLPESVQAMCNDAAQSVAPMLLAHLGDFIVTEGCEDLGACHSSIIA
jgi:hypothetical protein